ncbi:hypothetical protein ACYOEI_13930, partial [Singulisphaera rosea]
MSRPAGWTCVVLVCALHGWAIWVGLGKYEGLVNGWPLWRNDHSLYYHTALVTRSFLKATGTTAGYDPSFMSGYAKSVVFPSSSTLPELVLALFGGKNPALAYKLYVLISAALVPWMFVLAGVFWRLRPEAIALSLILFLTYIWTDFPINYVMFGMLPYFLAVPLGLASLGAFCRYLESGGGRLWAATAVLMSASVLVHFTTAMLIVPGVLLAYGSTILSKNLEPSLGRARHVGVWAIPFVVLVSNAFWWVPGIWLASTKGASDFAFAHPEGVSTRFVQILTTEAPAESVLLALGSIGILALLMARGRIPSLGLAGFVGAGVFWGYLAGGFRSLDFLQPGRHTYACYSGLALASGLGLLEILARMRGDGRCRLDDWAAVGLLVVGIRLFFPILVGAVQPRLSGEPFLSSRPSPRLNWVIGRVKRYVKPGERLLYEEGGFAIKDVPDPFQGGRFSGLLPERTGVEVLGGPYLHASLASNFTQFGEDKLFGKDNWGRDHFVRYAKLYRPSAILCWTPKARGFCRSNPDLVEVLDDDGTLLIGRVVGFPGATIRGEATVKATPGRLEVQDAKPDLDGSVVLRYHSVPCLRADPPTSWGPVFLEDDPVPFIRLRAPVKGPVVFEVR